MESWWERKRGYWYVDEREKKVTDMLMREKKRLLICWWERKIEKNGELMRETKRLPICWWERKGGRVREWHYYSCHWLRQLLYQEKFKGWDCSDIDQQV